MKGTRSRTVGRITINCMSTEARDLLDKLCEGYKQFLGRDAIDSSGYSTLYWACRYSGLIEPSLEAKRP